MTLSLLMLPCASLTPVPVSYTHTHTSPATVPSATRRHVSCHVINGQPRPHLLTIMKLTATLLVVPDLVPVCSNYFLKILKKYVEYICQKHKAGG